MSNPFFHRKPPLSHLVAARLRTRRTPPPATQTQREAMFLRISHADDAPAESTADSGDSTSISSSGRATGAESDAGRALKFLAQTGETLTAAQRVLRRVQDHLEEARQRCVQLRNGANLTDAQRNALQTRLQAALDAIELIAHTTQMDGRHLLDGTWSVVLPECGGGSSHAGPAESRLFRLPSCLLNDLGDSQAGKLAQLRRRRVPTNLAETILRCCQNRVSRDVQAIDSWMSSTLLPAMAQYEVAVESELAARLASDTDLMDQIGGITPLHALAAGQTMRPPGAGGRDHGISI